MKKTRVDLDPKGPITFEREVAIPTPTGEPLAVCFAFVVRSRVDYAQFVTRRIERMKAFEEPATEEARPPLAELAGEANRRAAENILDMASDWGIEGADFTRENLAKFCNLYPGAERAIFDDYQIGSLEGRLGNLPT